MLPLGPRISSKTLAMDAGRPRPYFAPPFQKPAMSAPKLSSNPPFACWEGAFTDSELDKIEAHGDSLASGKATLSGRDLDDEYAEIRITRTAWIMPEPETKWIFERMQAVIRALNGRTWQFDITGFSENFQYTVYQGDEGGHYDWHVDQGGGGERRKLSLSLQLSDPCGYDGCDLEFHAANYRESAPRTRGTVIAFPSYVLHRVTPITRGVRKAVVAWITGPKFR
jgi:PKHD-type hydroxylase